MLINAYSKNKMIRTKLPSLLIVANAISRIVNILEFLLTNIYDKSKKNYYNNNVLRHAVFEILLTLKKIPTMVVEMLVGAIIKGGCSAAIPALFAKKVSI